MYDIFYAGNNLQTISIFGSFGMINMALPNTFWDYD